MNESKIELVKQFFSNIEHGDFAKAEKLLTDDFEFSGPTPEPVDKEHFLEMHRGMVGAMPDWSFDAQGFNESGDDVTLTAQVSGTHTRELNIPFLGLRAVRATKKHAINPKEKVEIHFEGDKISTFQVEKVPNAGLPGILSQLGIALPQPAKR